MENQPNESHTNALNGKQLFPFIAPPNGGKGTQTAILSTHFNLPIVDMGACLRDIVRKWKEGKLSEAADQTLAKTVDEAQSKGELVQTPIVIKVLEATIKQLLAQFPQTNGFILDGFPRNIEQLDALIGMCKQTGANLAKAFYLNVPEDVVRSRASSRWFCSSCNAVYNLVSKPPKIQGVCDKPHQAGEGKLIQRDDDKPEKVEKRLVSFAKDTMPVIQTLKESGKLFEINGNQAPEPITQALMQEMNPFLKAPVTSGTGNPQS